jgi:hypothetical protein
MESNRENTIQKEKKLKILHSVVKTTPANLSAAVQYQTQKLRRKADNN